MAMLGNSCSTYTGSSSAGNASRHAITTPVYGISKNNACSGHILPNYAASLKYAFSAENSAGIIRQTLLPGQIVVAIAVDGGGGGWG